MKKQLKTMSAIMTYAAILLFAAWIIIASISEASLFTYLLSVPVLLTFLFFGSVLGALAEKANE